MLRGGRKGARKGGGILREYEVERGRETGGQRRKRVISKLQRNIIIIILAEA